MPEATDFDVAIVGMAGRFPGARTLDEFWANIAAGTESITVLDDPELLAAGVPAATLRDPAYVKAASVIDEPEWFDAGFFGFTPQEARTMDPQHRLLLELAHEALENAGCDPERIPGRVGVFTGSALNTYFLNFGLHARIAEDYIPTLIGNDKDFLSTRLSYKLNLRGPSLTVQTACSTSLVAVHLACQSLLSGESDLALAGAVAVRVPHRVGYFCDGGGIVSPDGHVRAFDAAANGTVFGSGAGVVVLRRLSDALANGDSIRAVIKGSAVNNDGAAKAGYTAPSVTSQADAVMEALANAGLGADDVGYVEAHGSGTPVGDPIEVRALTKAFRATTQRRSYCALGSVKANVGHLDVAAGIAGLIKTVLVLEHRQLPPTPHYRSPNPEIDFASSPFFVNTSLRPWESAEPRRAGVMATGMGGTNAHVVLEEAPAPAPRPSASAPPLIVLSARSEGDLDRAADRLAGFLSEHASVDLGDVAHTLQTGRRAFPYRRALVAREREEVVAALGSGRSSAIVSGQVSGARRPLVLLLPGLGDHYVGMGAGLYDAWPVFRDAVDRCAAVLQPHLGLDIRTLIYPASRSWERRGGAPGIDLRRMLGRGNAADDPDTVTLNRTRYAQPALFTIEYATACLWKSLGVVPDAIVGHSMGEYVAACLAGVLSLEDALGVLALRASLVEPLPAGAMLAVTLPEAELRPLLPESLSISLINGPQLCVVAGPEADVERFERLLDAREIIARRVRNAHAFHTPMLDAIAPALTDAFRSVTLHAPAIPYISNVSGDWITPAEATDPAYWARHATRTARFGDALERLWQLDDPVLVEAGPGRTLGVLAAQHPARVQTMPPTVVASLRHAYENRPDPDVLAQAIGRLWVSGSDVDWTAMPTAARRKVPLPSYPFDRRRFWLDSVRPGPSAGTAPSLASAPVRKRPDRSRWLYAPSWKRGLARGHAAAQHTARATAPETWLLLAEDSPFSVTLGRELEAAGHRVVVLKRGARYERSGADAFVVDPASPADYESVLRTLRAEGRTPNRVVHAWAAAEPAPEPAPEHFAHEQARGFYSLVFLARALASHASRDGVRLFAFSTQVQDVTGNESLCPARATLLAPSIVIAQEYPHVRVRAVDFEAWADENGANAAALQALGELFTPDAGLFVAYRNGHRWLRAYEPIVPAAHGAAQPGFRRQGVYVITGGLGEIGTAISEYLAERYGARLVLTGRAPLPAEHDLETWIADHPESDPIRRRLEAIRRIERHGGQVLYVQAEASDMHAMRNVMARARERFGTIHGVIHGAGIVGDQRDLEGLGPDGCEPHFLAKAAGADVLAAALEGIPVDFVLLMSSISAVLGGIGFCAYAASNLYLDATAHAKSRESESPWMSVDWDFWRLSDDGADDPSLGAAVRAVGMDTDEAMATLETVVAMRGVHQLVVSTGDLDARVRQWLEFDSVPEPAPAPIPDSAAPRPAVRGDEGAPRDDLERRVAAVWEAALGIPHIGVTDNFADLGGHSLLAVRIVGELRREFQVNLPVRVLFDAPTVAELAALIGAKIVAEIEALSEEEAGRLAGND